MSTPLQVLLDALALTQIDHDRYEGRSVEQLRPRMFGGELLAQTLMAAARTAGDRTCHALHVDFLAPGVPSLPVEYRVRRVRDGRRFAQRQVSGFQREREIVMATASFTAAEDESVEYQHERMPEVPGPDGLMSELAQRRAVAEQLPIEQRRWLLEPRAVDVRQVRPVPLIDPPPVPPIALTWIRTIGAMPGDQTLHCAVLAYASDLTLLDTACYPHGVAWIDPRAQQASLGQSTWFHRGFRMDEWLLYTQDVPIAAGGRALARGSVWTRDGVRVASVVQEGLSQIASGDSALGGR